ncbi:MAG: hypothetical protein J3K34DRAFT_420783 [Monoraphidium minutum]|nr:MAG: hypothetical protein J3K34DRAFT_420783 [Monoraphidium minutum]
MLPGSGAPAGVVRLARQGARLARAGRAADGRGVWGARSARRLLHMHTRPLDQWHSTPSTPEPPAFTPQHPSPQGALYSPQPRRGVVWARVPGVRRLLERKRNTYAGASLLQPWGAATSPGTRAPWALRPFARPPAPRPVPVGLGRAARQGGAAWREAPHSRWPKGGSPGVGVAGDDSQTRGKHPFIGQPAHAAATCGGNRVWCCILPRRRRRAEEGWCHARRAPRRRQRRLNSFAL